MHCVGIISCHSGLQAFVSMPANLFFGLAHSLPNISLSSVVFFQRYKDAAFFRSKEVHLLILLDYDKRFVFL
jgi:hypothetical protein